MKYLIKRIVGSLMWIVSNLYPYSLNVRLRGYQNVLYTMWIRSFIGHVGKHTTIAKPCSLQGGGQNNISIGDHTSIQSHSILGCWEKYESLEGIDHYDPEIIIGNHCSIGEYCHITAINKVTIGDGLLTGRFVYIGDNAHGRLSCEEAFISPTQRKLISKGEIKIGRNVWIGDKVSIFGGVTIGDNVIIGAGSIVTHDIPGNCMAAGMPAKIVKQL